MNESTNPEGNQSESMPAGFSPIESQEELDRRIKDRLNRAEKQWREKNNDVFEKAKAYDEWQEQNKSDLEKEKERNEQLQKELDERNLRDQISDWKKAASEETGVPAEVLRGSSEEEIKAHADALKPHFEKEKSGFVGSDGFTPKEKAKSTASQFADALDGIF